MKPAGATTAADVAKVVFDAMEARIQGGQGDREAATDVLALIRAQGLSGAWIDYLGVMPVIEFWRSQNAARRDLHLTGRAHKTVVSPPGPDETIFDTTWPTEEGWVKLGDMTAAEIKEQAAYYRKYERSYAVRADAFEQTLKGLEDGKTVRQGWKPDELQKVFRKALVAA